MKGLRHIIMTALLISGLIVSFAGCGGGGGGDKPEPPQGPYTRPIDFTDDFSDPNSGWATGGVYAGYEGGVYFIESNSEKEECRKSYFPRWLINNYRVKVDITNGSDNYAIGGLIFNWGGTYLYEDFYYVFTIRPKDQSFRIGRLGDYDYWSYLTKVYDGNSLLIDSNPGAVNWIEVEVNSRVLLV